MHADVARLLSAATIGTSDRNGNDGSVTFPRQNHVAPSRRALPVPGRCGRFLPTTLPRRSHNRCGIAPSMRWAVSEARPAVASGVSLACSARSAMGGQCGRAGAAGPYASSRRRGSWWRPWGCWRGGMGMGRADAMGKQWVVDAISQERRFRPRLRFRPLWLCCKTLQRFASLRASIHNHFDLDPHPNRRHILQLKRSAVLAECYRLAA